MPIAPLVEGTDIEAGGTVSGHDGPPAARRPEPELVAVPMDADQEAVYGWLGLNPVLLLEQPPVADNVIVRVVRPEDDAEAVLEEARQQLATSGSRRRRGRGGRGGGSGTAPARGSETDSQEQLPDDELLRGPAPVEITPLPLQLEPETVVTVSVPTRPPEAVEPEIETGIASPEPEPDLDEAGQPRRRRRRSSASG